MGLLPRLAQNNAGDGRRLKSRSGRFCPALGHFPLWQPVCALGGARREGRARIAVAHGARRLCPCCASPGKCIFQSARSFEKRFPHNREKTSAPSGRARGNIWPSPFQPVRLRKPGFLQPRERNGGHEGAGSKGAPPKRQCIVVVHQGYRPSARAGCPAAAIARLPP